MCIFTQKIPKTLLCFFHKNSTFQKSSCVLTKHLNPSNYKTCLYNLFVYLYTKNTKDPPVFFHKNTTFQKSSCVLTKHLNLSNYKTCLYNLFVYLYTKNTKDPPVFFHKNTTFQKSSCVLTKHLNPNNYKPCLYNLFVYLYTKKISKFLLCFFTKHYISKSSCVLTKHYISYQKHLNPSNYKPCLYNLFVYLYTKNTKDPPVFFHKNTTFQKILMCSHKTLFSQKHYISYQNT